MPKVFTSVVVGLGQIGMEYDYEQVDQTRVLTHAQAFARHPGFKLIGGVDSVKETRDRFHAKYGVKAYSSIDDMYAHISPEVVALAVPTLFHKEFLSVLLPHVPLAVICEKPLAENESKAEEIAKLASQYTSSILVNYVRRFEPGVIEIKRSLDSQDWGEPVSGNVWYSRGLINNASHFVDLAHFLFGKISDVRVIRQGRSVFGYDIEPDFMLKAGEVELSFKAWPSEYYSVNGFELLLERGRLRYDSSGNKITISQVQIDPLFPHKKSLNEDESVIENDLGRYQWYVAAALYDHLLTGKPLISTIDTALHTARIIEKIMSTGVLNAQR